MDVLDLPEVNDENPFIYGMSKQFVNALHELFDIMDSMGTGCVRFADIASQWEEDDSDPYFPKGLINCLSKVTLPNGSLTFDRFCAGIKLCLLKNQVDITSSNDSNNNGIGCVPSPPPAIPAAPPPPLLPISGSLEELPALPPPVPPHQSPPKPKPHFSYHSLKKKLTYVPTIPVPEGIHLRKPTASVSPVPPQPLHKSGANSDYNSSDSSSTLNYQRAKSMPQLVTKTTANTPDIKHFKSDIKLTSRDTNRQNNTKNRQIRSPIQSAKAMTRSYILKTLQNWKINVLGRQAMELERVSTSSGSKENILTASDSENYINRNKFQQLVPFMPPLMPPPNGPAVRRTASKRREANRRHTVGSNGIDFYSIRRIQQLEQERMIFFQGLDGIDRARDWYLRQIAKTQEKIGYVTKVGTYPADYTLDAYQERINFQAARIMNVNQHLSALFDSERGFPIHMNLAIRPIITQTGNRNLDTNRPQFVVNPNVVNRLKDQNRLLTEEVSKKCERITQLEREKSALIRELFQARTQTVTKVKTETEDTTFM